MSNMHRSLSTLTLNTPGLLIELQAFFTKPEYFTSYLEIDYLGSLCNFSNFKNLNLESHIIGQLHDSQDSNLASQFYPAPNCQLICSSKEDSYTSIYIIISEVNPFLPAKYFKSPYSLLRFSLLDLLGSKEEGLSHHIENIKNSIAKIQSKNAQIFEKICRVEKENKLNRKKRSKVEEENDALLFEFSRVKKRIIQLHSEFKNLEEEEAKCGIALRCRLCENNIKSIVFLPCGHLLICEECLTQNLKAEPNSRLERRRKNIFCYTCKVRVVETKLVFFK